MKKTSPEWKPEKIIRFIKNFPTGAGAILVKTDQGEGYLKAIGNPGGEHCLACEWVGTQLAQWFELPTFEFGLIEVAEVDELPFSKGGNAKPGPAFITRAEKGQPWSGKNRELKRLINPQDITRLVVFDMFALNCDRYSIGHDGKVRAKQDNVFLSEQAPKGRFLLKAMDHTHCFTCGKDLTAKLANLDSIRDDRVYGLFPEFRTFLDLEAAKRAVNRLHELSRAIVEPMTQSIPHQWDVNLTARKALDDLILARANFVAQNIENMLWPQSELDFKDAAENHS